MKYLVLGYVEFYQYVEADSEEEVLTKIDNRRWFQTMNQPIQNVQVKLAEVETSGSESQNSIPESAPEYK